MVLTISPNKVSGPNNVIKNMKIPTTQFLFTHTHTNTHTNTLSKKAKRERKTNGDRET